jgi:hypothetical protein
MHANIHTYKSLSPLNNTSLSTSHTISHTRILLQFLLTIFHAYYKQYSTHLTSANTSMLDLPSPPPVKLRPTWHTSHVY